MASTLTKYLAFMIAVHTLLYGAMAQGHIPNQSGDNPHKKYVDQFRGDNLTNTARVDDTSNIVDGTFGPAVKSLDFLETIGGIMASPYTVVANSGLPQILIFLVQGIMGLLEGMTIAAFLRGVAA